MRGLILLVLVVVGGCDLLPKRPNDAFCCLSLESCAEVGVTTIRTCNNPERPFCLDTEPNGLGQPYTCVADPLGEACETGDTCPSGRPFCVDGNCVQCESSDDCPLTMPVCNPETLLCTACEGDMDCEGRTGATRCDLDSGACIQCLGPEECSESAPICDANVCRACQADDECDSGVCDEDSGECIDEARIVYLSPDGAASGTCSKSSPCSTFTAGLAQVTSNRDVIKAGPGTYVGQVALNGVRVWIVGDDATIQTQSPQTAIVITNGADVTIENMTITGVADGILCSPSGGSPPTLRLWRSSVVANIGGGGVSISNCQFSLIANVIALNSNPTSAIGGVFISQISGSTGPLRQFAHNTVTANGGAADSITGVECSAITTPLRLVNNIVYGNQTSGSGAQVGGDSDCQWAYSDIGPQSASGDNNLNVDPQFVDSVSRNFRLMPTSPVVDEGDPEADPSRDRDGVLRPLGDAVDMGAYEVIPR